MKRNRYNATKQFRSAFTDRATILETFHERLRDVAADPVLFRAVSIVGLGGIGKSRLLEEIQHQNKPRFSGLEIINITLESERANGTIAAPLKMIKDRVDFDCLLFETALLRYWFVSGQLYQMVDRDALSANAVFRRGLEAVIGVTGFTLPINFAYEMFQEFNRRNTRLRLYEPDEFRYIDEIRDSRAELLECLPYFLATDVQRQLTVRKSNIAILYDEYDKQTPATLKGHAEWLQEFIRTLGRGLHVIASREPLRWPAEWDDVLDEVLAIDPLPAPDCRELIHRETRGAAADMIDHIIRVSHCVPFYVEAFIDAYWTVANRPGPVSPHQLPATREEATSRLFDHLDQTKHDIIIELASIQFFDEPLFDWLQGLSKAPRRQADFAYIRSLFFVAPFSADDGIYKSHDILTDFALDSAEYASHRAAAVMGAVDNLASRTEYGDRPQTILPIFAGTLRAASAEDRLPVSTVETMIDVGYRLYDLGFWKELVHALSRYAGAGTTDGNLVARFFYALSLRRTKSIDAGHDELMKLIANRERFGKHADSIDLELAYLGELRGGYVEARRSFGDLFGRFSAFDPTSRAHVRSYLYHADMLIMDGSLAEAADILLLASAQLLEDNVLDRAEYIRHRAHAYRFSLLFAEAVELYSQAQIVSSNAPGMLTKLHGNVAECYCWTAPHEAIAIALSAIAENELIGNRIEVSKNRSALCIAFAALGRFQDAEQQYEDAKRTAREVGYKAGELFAEVGGCVAAASAENVGLFRMRFLNARARVEKLGTYEHLLLLPAVFGGNERDEAAIIGSATWIELEAIRERARSVVLRFKAFGTMP